MAKKINSCTKHNDHRFNQDCNTDQNRYDYSKNLTKFLIAIDRNSRIIRFPKGIRTVICSQISKLVNKGYMHNQILRSITTDLEDGSDWNSKFDLDDFNELKSKLNLKKYKSPLLIYFNNLIALIQYLKKNQNNSIKDISIKFPFVNTAIIRDIAYSLDYLKSSRALFTYNVYVEFCNKRDDLDVAMTEEKFNNIIEINKCLEKPKSSRKIILPWKCKNENHDTWSISFSVMKNHNSKCPKCQGVSEIVYSTYLTLCEEREDLECAMTEKEFNNVMRINNMLPKEIRKAPSQVLLKWKCTKRDHIFPASYSNITRTKCPFCFKIDQAINYNDYLELGLSRQDLECAMSEEEFDNAMKVNNRLLKKERKVPSQVKLGWNCLKGISHGYWTASYTSIKLGSGCFLCGERIKIIGHLVHPMIEYFNLKLLVDLYNCSVSYETQLVKDRQLRPDLVITRNNEFRACVENLQNFLYFPDGIKFISVDVTFGLTIDWILAKCLKQYHNKNQFLIIVMLRKTINSNPQIINNLIQHDKNIDIPEHIIVIDFFDYLDFLGILKIEKNIIRFNPSKDELVKQKIADLLKKTIILALDSIESDSKFRQLKILSNKYSDLILKYNHNNNNRYVLDYF